MCSDGVADQLLPRTRLRFATRYSECSPTQGALGAMHLIQDAFGGSGVKAIVGARCSEASVSAAQISAGASVPLVSPFSTSTALSDGQAYPFFLRTVRGRCTYGPDSYTLAALRTTATPRCPQVPSDVFQVNAILEVLVHILQYTAVSVVAASDAYGTDTANTFVRNAEGVGVEVLVSLRVDVEEDCTRYYNEVRAHCSEAPPVTADPPCDPRAIPMQHDRVYLDVCRAPNSASCVSRRRASSCSSFNGAVLALSFAERQR